MVGGLGHNLKLRTVHGTSHCTSFGLGHYHRLVNRRFHQVRIDNGNGDRSRYDHFALSHLLPSIHPYDTDIRLHGFRSGYWELQFCGFVVCQSHEHRQR